MLEELFLSTSHAKFYTAISTVAVAPCIVGKSNMFRRSHLNALTNVPTRVMALELTISARTSARTISSVTFFGKSQYPAQSWNQQLAKAGKQNLSDTNGATMVFSHIL